MRRTLVSTVAIPVSVAQRQRLERIDSEDYGPVRRKALEDLRARGVTLSDEDADEAILALKQYYAVAVLDPLNQHAISDAIDPFWHAHILHTRQYEAFGRDVKGSFFHHEPLDHADGRQVRHVARLYAYTVDIFGRMFNYVNPNFYPRQMPDIRMVCLHGADENSPLVGDTIFAAMNFAA